MKRPIIDEHQRLVMRDYPESLWAANGMLKIATARFNREVEREMYKNRKFLIGAVVVIEATAIVLVILGY